MANAKKSRPTEIPKDDRREGYKLAIAMLRELEANPGLPAKQDNIVLRCLEKCRERSASVEAGFCAVLSDFISNSSEGFTLKATDYQKGLKIRVHAARISAADENLRTWKSIQRITGEDYGPMPPDFGTPGWAKKQRDARK
jgi:hypothetical protein